MADLMDEFAKLPDAPPADLMAEFDAMGDDSSDLERGRAEVAARDKALGRGALQGATFGFGDEITGALTGGMQAAANTGPGSALLEALGMDVQKAPVGDAYRSSRDDERAANERAAKDHTGAYFAGNVGGGIATGGALPRIAVVQGAGLGARLIAAMASAVPAGMAFGAGTSKADLTKDVTPETVTQLVNDTRGGGAAAGVLAPALTAVGAGLSTVPGALRRTGINMGRKVLTNGADQLSRRGPIREEAVEEALKSGAIVPAGTTRGAFERLEGMTEDQGQLYGGIVKSLEAEGVPGPDAIRLAQRLLTEAKTVAPNTMIDEIPALYRDAARKALDRADPNSLRLGLSQNESLKQSLQDPRLYGRTGSNDLNLGPERRDVARFFKEATEEAIDEGAAAVPANARVQDLAKSFKPVKQRYGNLAEARDAAERGTARGAQRAHIGPIEAAAGAAELARGSPLAALKAIGLTKLARTRGPSTGAWAAYQGGRGLGALELPFGAVSRVLEPSRGIGGASAEELLRGQLPLMLEEQLRAESVRRGVSP